MAYSRMKLVSILYVPSPSASSLHSISLALFSLCGIHVSSLIDLGIEEVQKWRPRKMNKGGTPNCPADSPEATGFWWLRSRYECWIIWHSIARYAMPLVWWRTAERLSMKMCPKFSGASHLFFFDSAQQRDGQRGELGNLRDIICKPCPTHASFQTSCARPPFRDLGRFWL